MQIGPLFLCVLATLGGTGLSVRGAEPWTDQTLPVRDGLELWLDATRENAARQASGLPSVRSGGALDFWHDGSGHRRHLCQRLPAARPRLKQYENNFRISFDGTDDCFAAANVSGALTNTSIFIFASPRSNRGGFCAFLALNQAGLNDYTSGLTIDLGPGATTRFETLNPEGRGFQGAANLLTSAPRFGVFHTLAVLTQIGAGGTRAYLDGLPQGRRDRTPGALSMDELTVGARCYSNGPEPAFTQGFFDGEIAEILIYSRALSDAERKQVESYLALKHAGLNNAPPEENARGVKPLVAVPNPPPVQMFVPGFSVRELPIRLNNVNNVKYRADGKLVAVGYDGKIHLLSDTSGDGLEDTAQPFWDRSTLRSPIGMALTPPGYGRGQGVFVAAKGKLALIVDTNGDDVADEEIVVVEGWKELPHGVDALGVAVDREGNVFFGLGTASFTDAYLVDPATGKSRYDLQNERGTILKVSADFSRREIVCTGIRFPVALAFNSVGDLFATDQEGATWLPNGNPLDELLHIQPGRHYGFPPRHPKHLPGVIDEPSVFDYRPQHQSTCGLNFNEPVHGGPAFGPAWWRGDALVTGYSRGKLYRTKLVPTAVGYVAQNQIIACLNKLAVDACVASNGDLILAAHSGEPDWGSGPNGPGRLYKVSYVRTNEPQPVLVYASGPSQICVAFDRPLDPRRLKNLAGQASITRGRFVAAGDRFESLRPGYAVVPTQMESPRFEVPVLSAALSADGRTLLLNTTSSREAMDYSVTLPGLAKSQSEIAAMGSTGYQPVPSGNLPDGTGATSRNNPDAGPVATPATIPGGRLPTGTGRLPAPPITQAQDDAIDLQLDLSGVQASWEGASALGKNETNQSWTGWLPHLDWAVARALIAPSAEHALLDELLRRSGTLRLKTQLDLWQMLRSATQPGSTLEFEYPPEKVTLVFRSTTPFKLKTVVGQPEVSSQLAEGQHECRVTTEPKENQWLALEISLTTGSNPPALQVAWHTTEDARPRALALRRMLLPWAVPHEKSATEAGERKIPELSGGHWLPGRRLFFSDQLGCGKCHRIGGVGGQVGPDLSNLVHRDYASVVKDIASPSAALNPDHIAYNVELKNGDLVTGVLRGDSVEELVLADASAQPVRFPKSRIASIKPSPISLMPEGLLQSLDAQAGKDLLTFLLVPALEPAPIEASGEPPPRSRAEVEAVLAGTTQRNTTVPLTPSLSPTGGEGARRAGEGAVPPVGKAPAGPPNSKNDEPKPLHLVLAAGPKDHGPGEHDYPLWQQRWARLLPLADNVRVSLASGWPEREQWQNADAIVFYSNNPAWSANRAGDLDAFLKRGGGLVYLHFAVDGHEDVEELSQRIGLAWRGGYSRFRHGPLDLQLHPHPLAQGFGKLNFIDESYWRLVGDDKGIQLLASGVEEGQAQPLIWTREQGPGRVFVSIPGHYTWTFDDPLFRLLILRGMAWSAHQPLDRLDELATIGARLKD